MEIPFASSPGSSLGVEWELQLVDRETRQLRSGATEILAELCPDGEHPKAKQELLESCVEVITGVCSTVGEATADLAATVEQVREAADRRGLGLTCSGTHPTTDWATQQITPKPRYQQLVSSMQWLARQLQIFGVHVHVGVRGPEKAIHIVNALTAYVPHLLALSASSPYWIGHDTGLASARSKVFEQLPTAGLPYQLSGWPQFEEYMETLLSTGTITSIKEVWWDIRPHPTYGTVELRVCDGLPTLHEVGMVAALSQCLVDMLDRELDRGYTLPTPKGWVVRENKWRAARHGLDAEIIVGEEDRTRPVRDDLLELVAELGPTAARLGCEEELSRVRGVLDAGASYQRQRAVAAASGGDLTAVVDSLLQEFADDRPCALPVL
ncbi:MAG: glutamate--cysteine ligase, partial [Actinomycetota bacterium]|nr:glutamate--cysteine ligase [Actinomycetota bacterium]